MHESENVIEGKTPLHTTLQLMWHTRNIFNNNRLHQYIFSDTNMPDSIE